MRSMLFLLFLFVGACGDVGDGGSKAISGNSPSIQIKTQKNASDLVAASPVQFSEECMSEVNMCWYKIEKSFGGSELPTVVVNKTLTLEHVAGINIAVDKDESDNVEDVELLIRSLPDNSRHEEYQAYLYALIDKVKAAGWHHYYAPSDPRVSGSQSDKITSPNKVLGDYVMSHPWLDPNYRLDLVRWLKVDDFYTWNFFNEDSYLTVKAWRRDSDDAPAERGTYLVGLSFKSQSEYWRSAFGSAQEKEKWKELLPAKLKEYQAIRATREEKAIDAGIEVDLGYQDPPIKALR